MSFFFSYIKLFHCEFSFKTLLGEEKDVTKIYVIFEFNLIHKMKNKLGLNATTTKLMINGRCSRFHLICKSSIPITDIEWYEKLYKLSM